MIVSFMSANPPGRGKGGVAGGIGARIQCPQERSGGAHPGHELGHLAPQVASRARQFLRARQHLGGGRAALGGSLADLDDRVRHLAGACRGLLDIAGDLLLYTHSEFEDYLGNVGSKMAEKATHRASAKTAPSIPLASNTEYRNDTMGNQGPRIGQLQL